MLRRALVLVVMVMLVLVCNAKADMLKDPGYVGPDDTIHADGWENGGDDDAADIQAPTPPPVVKATKRHDQNDLRRSDRGKGIDCIVAIPDPSRRSRVVYGVGVLHEGEDAAAGAGIGRIDYVCDEHEGMSAGSDIRGLAKMAQTMGKRAFRNGTYVITMMIGGQRKYFYGSTSDGKIVTMTGRIADDDPIAYQLSLTPIDPKVGIVDRELKQGRIR